MGATAVSVVVPTYERLEYLVPAVESIFAQTFTDWELIVADDASEDEALRAYLREIQRRPRVTVVVLPTHQGAPGLVRNAGLRAATGEYVAFLDSDDVWAPQKLERQVAALRGRPSCRWSYTGFRRVDRAGRELAEERERVFQRYEGDIFEQIVTGAAAIRTPSTIVERRLLSEVGGFDESLAACEDYDLWMRLSLRSPVVLVGEQLVDVRLHDRNYSLDWAISFRARDRSLANLRARVDPRWRALLQRERARNAVAWSVGHAQRAEWLRAGAALASSAAHGWRHLGWWWHGVGGVGWRGALEGVATLQGLARRMRPHLEKRPRP